MKRVDAHVPRAWRAARGRVAALWRACACGALVAVALPAMAGGARAPATAYVGVSVATLWTSPASPRSVDRPALGNPVDMRAWSRALTTALRRDLVGRTQTQALLGEPVLIVSRSGGWARVAVPDQPSPRDRRGYPGWVPAAQLVASARFGRELRGPIAIVTRPTAWLSLGSRGTLLSYGTRLPVVGSSRGAVVVDTPQGERGRLAGGDVARYASGGAIPAPRGATVVAAARSMLGVPYLWGGASAFGLDCSGLVELVFRAHGVTVPRDADPQAHAGVAVARSALRPGDLLFYGAPTVHHVTIYAGGATMLEAPNSGGSVEVSAVRSGEYAGARRYAAG